MVQIPVCPDPDEECHCSVEELLGYHYAEDTDPLVTTSGSFQEVLSLVTGVLEAGEYRVGWRFDYQAANTASISEYRIQLDDGFILDQELLEVPTPNTKQVFSNFEQLTLTAGAHFIDLDFRRSSGGGTVTIDDVKIEIWRVV